MERKYIPGMRLGQCTRIARLFNRKPSGAIRALKILETIDRNTRGTGGELKETRLLLCIPGADDLPEVLDNIILFLVATVVRVLLPVFHINIGNTTNKQLQFAFIKHVNQVSRDEFVETRHERIKLLFNTLLDFPFGNQPEVVRNNSSKSIKAQHLLNILGLVLIGDGKVPTTGHQINSPTFSKFLIINGKVRFNNAFDIIIPVRFLSVTQSSIEYR